MKKSTSIIIVNWNAGEQLYHCVNSVLKYSAGLDIEIIVVDNGSTDNSLELISGLPKTTLKQMGQNLGFAKACNIGAKKSEGDFILFLNPDMIVFEDTFINLFNYIYKHDKPNIGIYGIQLLDENGNIQKTCARFPSLWNLIVRTVGLDTINSKVFKSYRMDDWDHSKTKEVDQVIGAFFLVKKDLFKKLNGFDERFFVYFEELEFSKRAHDLGFKTVYITESKAYHKGGGTSQKVKGKRLFYDSQSRIIYAFKHFGFVKGLLLMCIVYLFEPIIRIAFLIVKRKLYEIPELAKGYFYLYKSTVKTIKKGLQK